VIRLDQRRRPGFGPEELPPLRAHPPTIRVLVIEDEDEDFLLLQDLLARAENARFRVERAIDAETGLLRLQAGDHDVCLVDYRLPGQDGLDLARMAARRGVRAPVILLSGLTVPELEIEAVEAGAADFLDKEQFEVERLERAIRMAMARAHRNGAPERLPATTGGAALSDDRLFKERLRGAVARARRQRTAGAVLRFRIEPLEPLLRVHGAAWVELILDRLADRLQQSVREADALVRLGDHGFGLVLEHLGRPDHAAVVARKLLEAIGAPLSVGVTSVELAASVGVALFPADAQDAQTLQALAEAAMARAAAEGGGRCCHHDLAFEAETDARLERAEELAQAIEGGTLVVHYQPQVTLCSAQLALAAVVRWRPRAGGLLEGAELHALAEAGGLLERLDDWLIAATCRQVRRWHTAGLTAVHVAVPLLSRRQFGWSGLGRRLEAHLTAAELRADALEVEVEETHLLEELAADPVSLRAIRELGVRLAVSGFGSGPTSLAVLRDAPLSTVKLARKLLQGVPDDRRRSAFVASLIRLARELELRLVAEGIESQTQLQMLRAQGCDAVQSFVSCPPLPAEACTDWLREAASRS
jgi:diguanylate cyclase (GGDEF)-like protein